MTTYPLAFPDVGIRNLIFSISNATTSSTSPYTGETQVYAFPGQWWEGQVTFVPTTDDNAGKLRAFLSALRGRFGTFTFSPCQPLLGAGGIMRVDGAGQTGRSLVLKAMTPNETVAKAGDYFQLGNSLYQFTQDVVSDGTGAGNAEFEPALRLSPADSEDITLNDPVGTFRMIEDKAEWRVSEGQISETSIAFREVISG